MKKLIFIALVALATLSGASASTPLRVSSIDVDAQGYIYMGSERTNSVGKYDKQGKILKEWKFPQPVTSLRVYGDRMYVTCSWAFGQLSCIDLGSGKELYKVPAGMGACGITISKNGATAYICNRYKTTVSKVRTSDGTILAEADVLREPAGSVITIDGKYLLVINALPQQRADVDYVASQVSVIELKGFNKVADIRLANGSNALRGITITPDGKYAYVSHNLGRFQVPTSQLQQGWMNTSAISVIDLKKMQFMGALLVDEPDRGAAGTWGLACNESKLFVSHSGTHDFSVIDHAAMRARLEKYENRDNLSYDLHFMYGIRKRVPVKGNGPRDIRLDGNKLYIPTYFSDTLNIYDINSGAIEAVTYNPGMVESREDIGEKAFNDATHCYQNWQSCNGCHPGEARTDGMNWDLMNDGIGNPKNCKSMLYSHVTNPSMISGIRATAEMAVRKGFELIQFSAISEDLAKCVDEYLRALRPQPSPYLVNGELSEKAKRGKEVFDRFGCGNCHNGPYYTDCQMHRIGDDIEFEKGWDTPTLIEVWRTAPYLFDGRAATMHEVFSKHKHGITGKITDKEIDELVEYVNSL